MLPSTMHEHVSDQLVDLEIRGHEEVQAEEVIEINAGDGQEQLHGEECQDVDDKEILCDCWYSEHDMAISLLLYGNAWKLLQNYEKSLWYSHKHGE